MIVNLLGQNLLLGCTTVVVALLAFALTRSKVWRAYKADSTLRRRYAWCAVAVVVISVLVQVGLQHMFPSDKLPLVGVMALPFLLSIGTLVAFWKKDKSVRAFIDAAK